MDRRAVVSLPLLLANSSRLSANSAHGDQRLEKLFTTFIAPCCWRANLLVHQSPKAEELRMDIEKRVAAGQSDEEIKAHYVRDYSLRILAMPEGTRGQLLSWAPWLAGGGGIGVVAATLQRLRRPAFEPSSANPLPELPELD